jgi:hypothetical protein
VEKFPSLQGNLGQKISKHRRYFYPVSTNEIAPPCSTVYMEILLLIWNSVVPIIVQVQPIFIRILSSTSRSYPLYPDLIPDIHIQPRLLDLIPDDWFQSEMSGSFPQFWILFLACWSGSYNRVKIFSWPISRTFIPMQNKIIEYSDSLFLSENSFLTKIFFGRILSLRYVDILLISIKFWFFSYLILAYFKG